VPNSLNGPRHWRIFVQRQGCASVAIIPHGREKNVAQVSFAEDDDMIKTFLSARANQSFRMPHSATPIARLMIIARNHLSKVDTVTIAHTRLCTKAHLSLPRHSSKTDRGRSRLMDGSRELNLAASFASGVSFRCRIGAALVRRPDRMSGKQAQTWEVPNVRACKDRSSPGKPNWCTLTMAKQHRDCARTELGRDSTA
jgi:hypothetical protein